MGKSPCAKRLDAIKEAEWSIKHGLNKREPVSQEELQKFITAIEMKAQGIFGLRTLAKMELDMLFEAPHEYLTEPTLTLLGFAAVRKRDGTVCMLLRGGASPTVRHVFSTYPYSREAEKQIQTPVDAKDYRPADQLHDRVFKVFQSLPFPYTTFIVMENLKMRHAAIVESRKLANSGEASSSSSVRCETGAALPKCQLCQFVNRQPLQYLQCGHTICEYCFWSNVCNPASRNAELCCAVCGKGENIFSDIENIEEILWSGRNKDWGYRDIEVPYTEEERKSADNRKAMSLTKFIMIDDGIEGDLGEKPKKFHGVGLMDVKRKYTGNDCKSRQDEFLKAAAVGDVWRLAVLIALGVDVDGINEYGQNAAFLASYHGHVDCLKVLSLWVNVNVMLPAYGGSTGLAAAIQEGHHKVAAFIGESIQGKHNSCSSLLEVLQTEPNCGTMLSYGQKDEIGLSPELNVMIPFDMDHPGAGALTIDGGFTDTFLKKVDSLFESLPVAPAEKVACNSRRYFSDTERWISAGIQRALTACGVSKPSYAFTHMRFLHYTDKGAELARHVDLAREDLDGRRSTHTWILYLRDCAEGGETALMYTAKMVPNKDREKRRRRKLKKRELAAQQEQEKQGSTSSSDQSITDSSQTEKEQQQSSGSNSNTLTGDSGSCVSDTTSHTEDLKATQQSAEKVKSEEQKLDDSDEIPDEFKVLAVVKPKRGRLLIFPHLTPHEGREVVDLPKLLIRGEMC